MNQYTRRSITYGILSLAGFVAMFPLNIITMGYK